VTPGTQAATRTARSRDGTLIAWERTGSGPALILVDGAMCHRAFGPLADTARLLARRFSVITWDRRGRGESGDTPPWAVEREVEDIAALIREAGGSAGVFGISSGAALAIEAAARGLPITKLALYEPPFIVDATRRPVPSDFVRQLDQALAADRPGDVIRMFMQQVGVPGFFIAIMRLMPMWSQMKKLAPTVPYDMSIMSPNQSGRPLPAERWAGVRMPTLVMGGGKSPTWMRNGVRAAADALPNARHLELPGQTHMIKAPALVPPLEEFFAQGP